MKGKIALVTGTNGAVGEALVEALLLRGAAKVYAAAKTLASVCCPVGFAGGQVVAMALDIADPVAVAAAVTRCLDVDLIVNNAGCGAKGVLIADTPADVGGEQVEVNCFGTLGMCLAFAPVLASRGGGTIVNVCSAVTPINLPLSGIYRAPLAARNIRVVRAYPAHGPGTASGGENGELKPVQIAEIVLDGVEKGAREIPLPLGFRGVAGSGDAALDAGQSAQACA